MFVLEGVQSLHDTTWRVGGPSKQIISRLISTLTAILTGAMIPISLQGALEGTLRTKSRDPPSSVHGMFPRDSNIP